jgi:Rab-like protein 2
MAEDPMGDDPADLKIILLGDSAVGKSKMVERFLMDKYNPRQLSTYALTLFRHNAVVDEREWKIDFWDTAGQEQFEELHPSYFFQANAAIMAFDVTRKVTYKNLEKWLSQMKRHCNENIPVVCVANKVDAEPSARSRSFKFPQENNMPFFHVSASSGENIVRVFQDAIHLAIKNKEEPEDEVMAEIWNLLKDDDNAGKVDED